MQASYSVVPVIITNQNHGKVSISSAKSHHPIELDFKRTRDGSDRLTHPADDFNNHFRRVCRKLGKRQGNVQVAEGTYSAVEPVHFLNRLSEAVDLLACVRIREESEDQAPPGHMQLRYFEE